jgi:hypothetical protein
MIVNRTMPKNKKPKAMKLLAKKLKKTKNMFNVSKLLRTTKKPSIFPSFKKQPCSHTMLKIDNKLIR